MYYLSYILAAVSAVIVLYFWLKSKKSTDNEGNLHKLKSAEQHLNNRLSECKKNIEGYKSEIFELRNNIKSLKIKSDELTRINISLEEEIEHLNKKQNRIEELQKQKEEFFAIYVHDLKNPTSTIQNLTELLNSYDLSLNEQKEIIDTLNALSKRIINLTNEICKVVVENEINLKFEFKTGKIQDILKKIYIRNIYKARKKNISILLNVAEDLPEIRIDPDKIEDALENLIDNAIKFSAPNKTVFIEIKTADKFITITVADQGLGFTDDDLSRIFIKGETLSARPTANESSSGLGLWIVKRIIDEHNGIITVNSQPEKGSKFTIKLPISL